MTHGPEDIQIELAALADGTLQGERREQLLAHVADSPELATELDRQRRALAIVGTLERVAAPEKLRRSIETLAADEGPSAGRSVSVRRGRRPGWLRLQAGVALAVAAVVVAVVAALVLTGGGGSAGGGPGPAPTLLQASNLALRPATRPAPAESSRNRHLLAASAAGIPYPYWAGDLGWRATGARADVVGGRTVTTVFYADRASRSIGYSIVSGYALPVPVGSGAIVRHGRTFHVVRRRDPTVVTWREAGHTCILTARAVASGTLVRLAAWGRA